MEFRDNYQTKELYSKSPKHGGPSTKTSLLAVHQYVCPSSPCATTIKTPSLSHFVRARTYIKSTRWGFWYPFSFGSLRVSIVKNPNILISKI